jgi:ABC-type lipoprotein export system ATPase subunit
MTAREVVSPAPDASNEVPVLTLSSIAASYVLPAGRRLTVFRSLSVDLRPGQLAVVAGRSGSGKTTCLNMAAGLLRPDDGDIHWAGQSILDLSDEALTERRRTLIGIVFQVGGLLEQLTAAENVALAELPRQVAESGRERATRMLDRVGLADRARHFPAQLSGGERQRVAFARALFSDPAVLIIDEPTANLDRRTADDIVGLMRSLRDEGRALLVASHDPHLLDAADQVVELD